MLFVHVVSSVIWFRGASSNMLLQLAVDNVSATSRTPLYI